MQKSGVTADLRTAQNSMFSFVTEALAEAEKSGQINSLHHDSKAQQQLYAKVHRQLLELLHVSDDNQKDWHLGIIDSGKRAIEALVSFFCPAEEQSNILVNTENYVAFNKFSAAQALTKQKGVAFAQPFALAMGKALTIDSKSELEKAKEILQKSKAATMWLAWNSTSTGVREKLEELVEFRNRCNSSTLIISDAASLPLFTESWKNIHSNNFPDVFFFSLRKQALPYDGPQDEANQAKNSGAIYLFNNRALHQAGRINGPSLYDMPRPADAAEFAITSGVQRENHIRHLLKLQESIAFFSAEDSKRLKTSDATRREIRKKVCSAFGQKTLLARQGFKLLADSKLQSDTAYIVKVPDQVKPAEIVNHMKEHGVHVSISMHPQVPKDSYFRFASYPATSLQEIDFALQTLENFSLRDTGK